MCIDRLVLDECRGVDSVVLVLHVLLQSSPLFLVARFVIGS